MISLVTGKMCIASVLATMTLVCASAHAEPDRAAAREHFVAGEKFFDIAEYDKAIAEYKEAFKIDPNSVFLYNIAQSYRLKAQTTPSHSDCSNAVQFYKKFIAREPASNDRAMIDSWVTQLQACVDKMPVEPVPAPITEPIATPLPIAPSNPGHGLRVGGVATTSVGVALLLVGGTALVISDVNANTISNKCGGPCQWSPDLTSHENTLHTANTIAAISLSVGGAAVIAGTVMYYLGHGRSSSEQAPVAIVPTSGGAMFVTSGSF